MILEKAVSKIGNIDIVVTHTAPNFCYPINDNVSIVNGYHEMEKLYGKDLKQELRIERAEVTALYDALVDQFKHTPKYWFYGHFHSSKVTFNRNIEFILLDINEIKEI